MEHQNYTDLLNFPGFQRILYYTRNNTNNGGGVEFYVRNGLHVKQNTNFVTNHNNIFESISIDVQYPHRSIILSNIYRSLTAPPNLTQAQAMEAFLQKSEELLNKISSTNKRV
jgi:hypothetical protein